MATQTELAGQHRAAQAAVAAAVTRDTLRLWMRSFRPDDPQVWRALLELLRGLIVARRGTAAALAAAYYRRSRETAGVVGPYTPVLPDQPPAARVDATAGITGPGAYQRSLRAGRTVEQARRNAGVQLSGAVAALVTEAARDTVTDTAAADREALGWVRITDAKPCAFCAMLASRGPSYRSRETAGFQAHAHCRCVAAAVFSRDEAWLGHSKDLAGQWQDATAGLSGAAARLAWRRYWDTKQAGQGEADASRAATTGGRQ